MVNRYLKFNGKQSFIKKTYKGVIKAAKTALVAGLMFSATMGMISGAQEVYQEATSANILVDVDFGFGSVILKNKDTRTREELFADIEKAVFEIEGIERVFNENIVLTREEKMDLTRKVIKTIAKEAHIATDNFYVLDKLSFDKHRNTNGLYVGLNTEHFTIASDGYYFLSDLFDEDKPFKESLITIIHEPIHGVIYENRTRSNQMSEFDKLIHSHFIGKRIDYFSSFAEIEPTLFSIQLVKRLEEKFFIKSTTPVELSETQENEKDEERDIQYYIFTELLYNLYDVNISKGYVHKDDLQTLMQNYMGNTGEYRFLTLDELIMTGFKQKLDNLNINYEGQNLKESIYYKSLTSYIAPELLNVRYYDYEYNIFAPQYENIKEEIERFKDEEGNLFKRSVYNYDFTFKLTEYLNIIRYDVDGYSEEDRALLKDTILGYAEYVSEENVKRLGFYNVENIIKNSETQSAASQEVDLEP